MPQNFVKAVPMTSFNTAGLAVGYVPLNPLGLQQPCFLVKLVNNSTANVIISYDGINDNDIILANSTSPLNFQANAQPNNMVALLSKGAIVYVRGAAVGVGLIYLVGYYV